MIGLRYTGFPAEIKELIDARSQGCCEVLAAPNCTGQGEQHHHRRARGLGGTKRASTNYASAGLHVCYPCHALIESRREEALTNGWLVRQHQEPQEIPVLVWGEMVYLQVDGTKLRVEE